MTQVDHLLSPSPRPPSCAYLHSNEWNRDNKVGVAPTQCTCLPQILIVGQNLATFQSTKDLQVVLHKTGYHHVQLKPRPLGKPDVPVVFEDQSIVFIFPEVFLELGGTLDLHMN